MPALRAALTQLLALALVATLARQGALPGWLPLAMAALQGLIAAIIARITDAAQWWLLLHLLFAPALVIATLINLPVWIYAAGFIALVLVYWTTFRTQVPLFLSSRAAVVRFAQWLNAHYPAVEDAPDRDVRIVDVGSGTGRFVIDLARQCPDCAVTGIESAPLPWLLARDAARRLPNVAMIRDDFWKYDFADFHVVYAFLSPVPMAALWRKCQADLKPGSWLISNSFPVPNVEPSEVIEVPDRRGTRLYVYAIPDQPPFEDFDTSVLTPPHSASRYS